LAFHVYSQTVVADDLLAVFGRGASRLAVTIILALRFFPIMANEATRLWEVQRTRGWAEGRGFVQRLRARWPLLQALLVAALERSWQVGEAMQARGFGAGRRSCYLPLTVRPRDWLWRIILMVSLAAAVYLGWQGQLSYQFFPYLGRTGWPNPGLMLMLLGLAGPVLVSWWWNRCPSWRSKI
jgi:energy-coupling factor transport system permease protein